MQDLSSAEIGKGGDIMKNKRFLVWLVSFVLVACKVSYKEDVRTEDKSGSHLTERSVERFSEETRNNLDSVRIDYKMGNVASNDEGERWRVDTFYKERWVMKDRWLLKRDTAFVVVRDTIRTSVVEKQKAKEHKLPWIWNALSYVCVALVFWLIYKIDRRNMQGK